MVNDQERKAGHSPATKVGGVRRRVRSKSDNVGGLAGAAENEAVADEVPAEEGEEGAPTEEQDLQVAETDVTPVYKENTVDAVKSYHDKPMPTKNIQIKNPQIATNIQIQQPRK